MSGSERLDLTIEKLTFQTNYSVGSASQKKKKKKNDSTEKSRHGPSEIWIWDVKNSYNHLSLICLIR